MKTRLLLLAALTAAPAISVAQTSSAPADPASLVVCADEKDDAARLACYDWQAARQRAAAKSAAQAANGAGKAANGAGTASSPAASPAPAAAAAAVAPAPAPAPASAAQAASAPAHAAASAATAPMPPAPAAASASASGSASGSVADPGDPNYGLQGSQLRKAQGREGMPKPPKPQPLVAAVSSVKQYTASEVRVTLNNGQVWEQAESRTGFWLQPGQTVTITPGVLGSFFLTDDQHQRVRVKRIL
jgi:hypothetical protein